MAVKCPEDAHFWAETVSTSHLLSRRICLLCRAVDWENLEKQAADIQAKARNAVERSYRPLREIRRLCEEDVPHLRYRVRTLCDMYLPFEVTPREGA